MRSNQYLDEQQPIIFKKSLHHILHLIQYRKSFIWLVKYFLNFPTFAFFIMIWHFKSWKQGNKETNFCQCSFDISHPSRDQDIANTIITERILITGILLLHIVGVFYILFLLNLGDSQHFVISIHSVLSRLAAGQGWDGQRVFWVPGVSTHRRPGGSVAHCAPEPVLGPARGAGARDRGRGPEAGDGERPPGGGGRGQRVLGCRLLGGRGACRAVIPVTAVTGAAVGRGEAGASPGAGAPRGVETRVERRHGLALLVKCGGLDLLLWLARQVHLDTDTLLLPPGNERCKTQFF